MLVQISSGRGPAECELAVGKMLIALQKEFSEVEVIECTHGKEKNTFASVIVQLKENIDDLEGTVQWTCQSPYRPFHKRKNWYIQITIMKDFITLQHEINQDINVRGKIHVQTFRCSGKGGQHVNKVETGVRIIHEPTGIIAISTEARSQYLNKQIAINRLCQMISEQNIKQMEKEKDIAWRTHAQIIRGNPIRIYKGLDFTLKSKE